MDPFSETARATRSISEPLTKAEREALAMSAVTAAADATRKAGDGESAQASAARSAEEAVHQATHTRSEEGSTPAPPQSGGASGETREMPPQHVARESADAKAEDYARARAAEASRDWRHSFGEQQRHGVPTKHTGLQHEYGRE